MSISETAMLKKNVIYKATHYPADLSDCGWWTALFGDDSIQPPEKFNEFMHNIIQGVIIKPVRSGSDIYNLCLPVRLFFNSKVS